MGRKAKTKKADTIQFLEEQLENNVVAIKEHVANKKISEHDLRNFKPITEPLRQMAEAYYQDFNILGIGSTGTGKTTYLLYLALKDILSGHSGKKSITIIRSAVSSRDLGFLPGDEKEKTAVYEKMYYGRFAEITGKPTAYDKFKKDGIVNFECTSFLRGETINDSIIILDEVQNCNFQELDTVMTRIGRNSSIHIIGDLKQCDLIYSKNDKTGLPEFYKIIEKMKEFSIINFLPQDIIRSGLVKSYIMAKENL